ncbi:DUF3422 family protein [Oricola sp.]|uniref:DUF3422 family protein n=1 Tax=Oricola sp. TaxID=1979950 RepID=UPI0025D23DAC|nr:DUF3422 family protein [Oricola sp.]MCI5078477.1 DUF3422 family protein [Oricola sp.]
MNDATTPSDPKPASTPDSVERRGAFGFPLHANRATALGEIHSRPAPSVSAPRALIKLCFMTEGGSTVDHAVLSELSRRHGSAPPEKQARHHTIVTGKGTLQWERHTEASTYLWQGPLPAEFGAPLLGHPFGEEFPAPGTLIAGVRMEIREHTPAAMELIAHFDPATLCCSSVEGGLATIVTDFRQDASGLTQILVLDKGMSPQRTGALAQRLFDIEIYRTLAMLGLPLAQRLSPRMRKAEDQLAALTNRMRSADADMAESLLDEITALAADLEADAASSLYRFGASRAYDEIVHDRLDALGEELVTGYETWRGFLVRRTAPAMRTCRSVEDRLANLSRKLARAATLLRTKVDVAVEKQNRDLLHSMNTRAKLQLRLQQTVEGLSVAAVSYYVVGLIAYVVKGLEPKRFGIPDTAVTAVAVPFVVLAIWAVVRRIRRSHSDGAH